MMVTPRHDGRNASHLYSIWIRKEVGLFLAATTQCERQRWTLMFSDLKTAQLIHQYVQTNGLPRQKKDVYMRLPSRPELRSSTATVYL